MIHLHDKFIFTQNSFIYFGKNEDIIIHMKIFSESNERKIMLPLVLYSMFIHDVEIKKMWNGKKNLKSLILKTYFRHLG